MRISATHLGIGAAPLDITPPDLNPKVPVGYDPITGTVDPSNTTGATTVGTRGPGSCPSGLVWDPKNEVCFDCASIGQQLDTLHDICVPVTANYTAYILAGAVILGLFFVIQMVKR
jgi:hypothetical protein